MRITGGKARGIHLKSPKDQSTRPATDRTRESLFSSLATSIVDASCLDLFAGTGSYGFEALSRGAQSCQFIEYNRSVIKCIKENAEAIRKSMELNPKAVAIKQSDLLKTNQPSDTRCFDCIFLDPPYALWESHADYLLHSLAINYSHNHSLLILECPSDLNSHTLSPNWVLKKRLGKAGKGKPNSIICQRVHTAS